MNSKHSISVRLSESMSQGPWEKTWNPWKKQGIFKSYQQSRSRESHEMLMQRERSEQQEVVDIPLPSVANLPRIDFRASTSTSVIADPVIIGLTYESEQLPTMASATIVQDNFVEAVVSEHVPSPSVNILDSFEVLTLQSQYDSNEATLHPSGFDNWDNLYTRNTIRNEVEIPSTATTSTTRNDIRVASETTNTLNSTDNFIKKTRKSCTEFITESLFGQEASISDVSREIVQQRELLAYEIVRRDASWDVVVNLKQYRLRPFEKSPQGRRNDVLFIGNFKSYEHAFEACISNTPPVWDSKKDVLQCHICAHSFGLLNIGHHCRNCGKIVCSSCSEKFWNSNTIPETYHNAEDNVRICDVCANLNQKLYESLLAGDYNKCKAIYATGNVNIHCPFSNHSDNNRFNYAVHLVAISGNLNLMKWLIEEKFCTLVTSDGNPLLGYSSESVFELACKHGNTDIMKYLIHNRHSIVTEVKNMSILYRALHSILDSPGEMPSYKSNQTFFFEKLQNENVNPVKEQQGHVLKTTKTLNEIAHERVALSLAIHESNTTAEL